MLISFTALFASEHMLVTGVTSLRRGPGSKFASTMVLRRGMTVVQSDPAVVDGYVRVRVTFDDGIESGWVEAGRLHATNVVSPSPAIRAAPAHRGDLFRAPVGNRDFLARAPHPLERRVNAVDRTLQLVFPVAGGRISSSYGPRSDPFTGTPAFHYGIDISAPEGTPIAALDSGKVVFSGSQGGFGRLIVLDHGRSCRTYYAHISTSNVRTGGYVQRGDVVGYVGSTGRATGPHLHLEVRSGGRRLRPQLPGVNHSASALQRNDSHTGAFDHDSKTESPCDLAVR